MRSNLPPAQRKRRKMERFGGIVGRNAFPLTRSVVGRGCATLMKRRRAYRRVRIVRGGE